MPRNPAKVKAAKRSIRRSVLEYRNGRAVKWCYVIPADQVNQLRRRISKNPNSQTNRALSFLGLPSEFREHRPAGKARVK